MHIAILGAGAWGTALAIAFAPVHSVTLWARDPAQIRSMQATAENRRYLAGHAFPDSLALTADFAHATEAADLILIATPLAGLHFMPRRV